MGCPCKEKYAKIAKYSEDEEVFKSFNIFEKILAFFGRLLMVILIAALIIIILPLFLLYMIFCYLIGKEVVINLSKFTEYISRHNKDKEILTD